MSEAILHFIKMFTDNTIQWTSKLFAFFIALMVLWILNDTFDFIHSYRTSNKLQQFEKLSQLLSDTTLTPDQRKNLLSEKEYLFRNRSKLDCISSLYDTLYKHIFFVSTKPDSVYNNKSLQNFKKNTKVDTTQISIPQTSNIDFDDVPKKNYLLHFFFSNVALIALMFSIPYFVFQDKINKFGILVLATLIIWAGLILLAVGMAKLLDLIPILFGQVWISYLLDFIIQFIVWFLVFIAIGVYVSDKQN
jgi:hypothetical protein